MENGEAGTDPTVKRQKGSEDGDLYQENNKMPEKSKKVWSEAEPIVNDWARRLTEYEEKHRTQISQALDEIATFFGEPVPDEINVDLHYLAQKDSSKGEPASGLASQGQITQEDTDVFCWLGPVTRLEKETPRQGEENERMQTTKIIHEEIHEKFQGDNKIFTTILEKSNGDGGILKMRNELMGNQLNYLEPEAELTAIYLEHYADKLLQSTVSKDHSLVDPIIKYRVSEKRFNEIFAAVVFEGESEKWKNGGPYKRAVDGWRGIYENNPTQVMPVENIQNMKSREPSIYDLGERITDFSLIEKYLRSNRQFDLEFMRELYKIFLEKRNP